MTGLGTINYLALFISAVAAFIIGFIWYGFLFKKLWVEGHAFSEAKAAALQKTFPIAGAVSFVGYLVTAYILCLLLSYMNITDVQNALRVTFLLWLGFPAVIGLMNAMYSGQSLIVYAIDTSYQLVYMLVTAIILTVWR